MGFGENDQGALSFPHFIEFEKSMEERELSTCRYNLLTHFPRIANEKMLIHKVGGSMEKASGQEEKGQDSHLVSANKQFGALSKLLGLQFPHFYKEVFGFTNNFF